MDYFWLRQDKRYLHTPVITNLSTIIQRRKDVSMEHAFQIPNINVGFAKSDTQIDFIDVLDSQIYLIKEEVKEVFEMYEPDLQFKALCILDNSSGEYGSYHIPIFPEVDCLSPESIISPDKTLAKKLVIRKDMSNEFSIFKVLGLYTDVVLIRLDVAESLLRRKLRKFSLTKVNKS